MSLCFLGSCVGVRADITINRDGGGTATLEYRVSRLLESLGKLDGNAPWPTVPVGKADFERTVARIEGLELLSFTSDARNDPIIETVQLKFTEPAVLLRFLDNRGRNARFSRDNGKSHISLTLGEDHEAWDPDLAALAAKAGEGYSIDLRFNLPRNAELSLRDAAGQALALPPAGTVKAEGSVATFSVPLSDFIRSPAPFTLDIRW
ncbi:MAG: hypothetical protein LBQ38_10465 [Spirochaetaceae bacterium]|nr:hypothetical protein [Spirochaetaceae bacterium]